MSKRIFARLCALAAALLLILPLARAEEAPPMADSLLVAVPDARTRKALEEGVLEAFLKAHPGISVHIAELDGPSLVSRMNARQKDVKTPDLIVGPYLQHALELTRGNRLISLEGLPGHQELLDSLAPVYAQNGNGIPHFLPVGSNVQLMACSRALLEEAGIGTPPKTHAQFLEYAARISALPPRPNGAAVYGAVFWNEALSWGSWYWDMLSPIYRGFMQEEYRLLGPGGPYIFEKQGSMAGFLTYLAGAQAYAPQEMQPDMFSGSVGMWLQMGYDWRGKLGSQSLGEDSAYILAPLPTHDGNPATGRTDLGIMLAKSSAGRQNAAWAFARVLLEEEPCLSFLEKLDLLPAQSALWQAGAYQNDVAQAFLAQLPHSTPQEAALKLDSFLPQVQQKIKAVAVDRSETPEEAVKALTAKAKEIFRPAASKRK